MHAAQATNGRTIRPRLKTFTGGVHLAEYKELTQDKAIRRLPFPPWMIIPLSQHAGAPAVPVVREGQEVVRGEPIAHASGFVSVPMHAPATGLIHRIALAPTASGRMVEAIYLKLYPGERQEVLYGARRDIYSMTPKEVIAAVQETGVVGLGGAAFPTHVKLSVPEGKHVDTIVANGCECEPYLTTDHRVMLEMPDDVIAGTRIVMHAMGAKQAVIGIEDNKLDAAEAVKRALSPDDPIKVGVVPTKYPQGAEKMLVKVLLDREIPSGGLPVDVGVGVFNVATLAQIGELLPRRQGLIERVVTVTGPGVDKPGNYLTALGTPLDFLLEQAGVRDDAGAVVLGGPMMGVAVASVTVPVTKGVTGVLVLDKARSESSPRKVYPCIKCAACVEACPLGLNPSRLGMLARFQRYEEMETDYHVNDCFECGCCAYVCPSNIPLVQYFRVAKQTNRERKAAK